MKFKKRILLVLLSILLLFSMSLGFANNYPRHTSNFYVNDFASVLSAAVTDELMQNALELYEATGAQLVVVTVDSLNGENIESYARGLFNEWGIGDARDMNGVLILLSISDRQSRVEVGYGLEGALNDAKTGRIQDDYMISFFQANQYGSGLLGGAYKIAEEIYAEYGIEKSGSENYYRTASSSSSDAQGEFTIFHLIGIVLLVLFMIIDMIFNRGRLTRLILYTMARSSKGGKGGGGFRGGGGRSGGGGSTRSW